MIGSARLCPGEAALAHHGVLFLDELPEYRRDVLESLRGPLESRQIFLSRAAGQAQFPAAFMLVATANPCPCGYATHPYRPCGCSPKSIQRYQERLSGPLLDRIDIQLNLQPVSAIDLIQDIRTDKAKGIQKRITTARERQRQRTHSDVVCNAQLPPNDIQQYCALNPDAQSILKDIIEKHHLSARGLSRILKVARSIADIEDQDHIAQTHLVEATSYRVQTLSERICLGS